MSARCVEGGGSIGVSGPGYVWFLACDTLVWNTGGWGLLALIIAGVHPWLVAARQQVVIALPAHWLSWSTPPVPGCSCCGCARYAWCPMAVTGGRRVTSP